MDAVSRGGTGIAVAGGGSARVFFGPFVVGERVESVLIALEAANAAAGDAFMCEVKTFGQLPPNTAAAFAANGRPITGRGTGASQPRLGYEMSHFLPLDLVCESRDVFIGVELSDLVGGGGLTSVGHVFVSLSRDDKNVSA